MEFLKHLLNNSLSEKTNILLGGQAMSLERVGTKPAGGTDAEFLVLPL